MHRPGNSRTDNSATLKAIKTSFRAYSGKRNLYDYDFVFEHGHWWVLHKPTGIVWSVVDTGDGFGFEET